MAGFFNDNPCKRRNGKAVPPFLVQVPYFSTFTMGAAQAEKVRSSPPAKRIFTR